MSRFHVVLPTQDHLSIPYTRLLSIHDRGTAASHRWHHNTYAQGASRVRQSLNPNIMKSENYGSPNVHRTLSTTTEITFGVPLGYIFCPVLFLLHILNHAVNTGALLRHADDKSSIFSYKSAELLNDYHISKQASVFNIS